MLASFSATLIAYTLIAIYGLKYFEYYLSSTILLFIWYLLLLFINPSDFNVLEYLKIISVFLIITTTFYYPRFITTFISIAFLIDFGIVFASGVEIDKTKMLPISFFIALYYVLRSQKLIKYDLLFFVIQFIITALQSIYFDSRSLIILQAILLLNLTRLRWLSIKFLLIIPFFYFFSIVLFQDDLLIYFGETKSNIERSALLTALYDSNIINIIFPSNKDYVYRVNQILFFFNNEAYSLDRLDPHSYYASIVVFSGLFPLVIFIVELRKILSRVNWSGIYLFNKYLATILLSNVLILITQSPPSTDVRIQIAVFIGLLLYMTKLYSVSLNRITT